MMEYREAFNSPARRCPFCGGYDSRQLGEARCWGYRDGPRVYCTNEATNAGYERVPGGDTFSHWYGAGECKTCHQTHEGPTPGPKVVQLHQEVEVGHWDYPDEHGTPVTRVVRYETPDGKKTYRQKHLDENGNWVYGQGHIAHLLYRLPEILALPPNEPIVWVEGEKAADACWEMKIAATTNIGGAGKAWHEDYTNWLYPHPVVIIPDNDPQEENGRPHHKGQDHAAAVAAALKGRVAVKLCDPLPGVPLKGDTYDFFITQQRTVNDFVEHTKKFEWMRPKKFFYRPDELDLLPDPKWLLEDMLAFESIAMTLGESEVGKTFYSIHLAARVATETAHQVIYIGIEAISQYKERIKAWFAYYGKNLADFPNFILMDFPLQLFADGGNTAALVELISQAGFNPALIVVDTYHAATEGAEENSAKDTGIILANLRLIRNRFKCCVNVLHHLNAAGIRERGSSALRAGIDTVLALKAENDGVKVECTKQRSAPHFQTRFINWAYIPNPVDPDGPPSRVAVGSSVGARVDYGRAGKNDTRVLQLLGGELYRASGMRFTEIQDALGDIAKSSLNAAIKKCQNAGWVSSGSGLGAVYIITNDGLNMVDLPPGSIEEY